MQIAFCLISWREAALEEIPETTALLKSSNVSREMEKSMVFWGAGGGKQNTVSPKALVIFRSLVTGMQLAKEFCGVMYVK